MFEHEIDDILRELLRERGALGARVVSESDANEIAVGAHARRALGNGAELVVTVGAIVDPELPAAIDRAARELRACIRRHGGDRVPEVTLVGRAPRPRAALLAKARAFLGALATMHGAVSAVVLRGAHIVAEGGAVDEAQRERLTFLRKRIDAEAARRRGRSSHAEVVGEDVFARSFWFDAYLVVFFGSHGFALDFVRHRARAVTRALAVILPHLDDEPPAPADVRPLPPRK